MRVVQYQGCVISMSILGQIPWCLDLPPIGSFPCAKLRAFQPTAENVCGQVLCLLCLCYTVHRHY